MSARSTKLLAGAYVTDGTGLYEVARVSVIGPGVRVEIEDCTTLTRRRMDITKLHKFRLVRAADSDEG